MSHTPGSWKLGEYDEHLGYDCMTGGIRVGPVVLDGHHYGQASCTEIPPEALERMRTDARLIAAAPDMYAAIRAYLDATSEEADHAAHHLLVDAIGKADGP